MVYYCFNHIIEVSQNSATLKKLFLLGFSVTNHPAIGVSHGIPIDGTPIYDIICQYNVWLSGFMILIVASLNPFGTAAGCDLIGLAILRGMRGMIVLERFHRCISKHRNIYFNLFHIWRFPIHGGTPNSSSIYRRISLQKPSILGTPTHPKSPAGSDAKRRPLQSLVECRPAGFCQMSLVPFNLSTIHIYNIYICIYIYIYISIYVHSMVHAYAFFKVIQFVLIGVKVNLLFLEQVPLTGSRCRFFVRSHSKPCIAWLCFHGIFWPDCWLLEW